MEQERPTQKWQNQDVSKIQSQKTTEYSRKQKQKQAKGAQVIEITVYKGWVKQQEQNKMTNIKCTKASDRNHSALRTS